MRLAKLVLVIMAGSWVVAQAALTPDEIKTLPSTQIEAALPNDHPSSFYAYAVRLFGEGRKDDAVFWFYVGQLRYRIFLKATPPSDPSGDPALFGSLNATIGQTINEYAGGNPVSWAAQIDRALKWDDTQPNKLTPKSKFPEVHAEIRSGLEKLRVHVVDNADKILADRKKNGLDRAPQTPAESAKKAAPRRVAPHGTLTPEEFSRLTSEQVEARLPDEHPMYFFVYTRRLVAGGKLDDAAFWFYVGQIRFLAYLNTNPADDESGAPAQTFALAIRLFPMEIGQREEKEPAFLAAQIGKALDWDAAHDDIFTPKDQYAKERDAARAALAKEKARFERQVEYMKTRR